MSSAPSPDNRHKVLDAAEHLLQTRGFNAFSYRDLADVVGIKTSSIHYYFATKEDLGVALIGRYTAALQLAVTQITEGGHSPSVCIQKFIRIFEDAAGSKDRLCLAGMLASDFSTLSADLQLEVRRFFQMIETWLAQQICQLRSDGQSNVRVSMADREKASWVLATLEGALLTGRVLDDATRMNRVGAMLLDMLTSQTLKKAESS